MCVILICGTATSSSFSRAVFVSNLEKINYFIQNRKEVLSDKDVKKIIGNLKNHVTN